jgi:hypothetical protein
MLPAVNFCQRPHSAGSMKFRVVVWYRKVIRNFKTRRFAFTIALVTGLFPYMANSANAATFDLLPNNTFEIEITGDLSTPGSITITESMQPTLDQLILTSGATGFAGYIYNTEVYQSGSVNTGFVIPQACTAPGECGLLAGVVECVCGIELAPGYIIARNGSPVTISVTDISQYFQFVDDFSTVGLVTNVGVIPFDLQLTVDASDGLDIQFIQMSNQETTPLPAALPLFATGLGALGLLGWRRKRKLQI